MDEMKEHVLIIPEKVVRRGNSSDLQHLYSEDDFYKFVRASISDEGNKLVHVDGRDHRPRIFSAWFVHVYNLTVENKFSESSLDCAFQNMEVWGKLKKASPCNC